MKLTPSNSLAEAAALTAIAINDGRTDTRTFRSTLKRIEQSATPSLRPPLDEAVSQAHLFGRSELESFALRLRAASLAECLSEISTKAMSSEQIKANGAIHTPPVLADFIVQGAYKRWARQNPDSAGPMKVGDLSSGAGAFLNALAKLPLPAECRVHGIEKDLASVVCSDLIKIATKANWELSCADSLSRSARQSSLLDQSIPENNGFDLLVGNPPYVRSPNLPATYVATLRNTFETIPSGNFDLSIAFLEQAIEKLRPNGVFSYITSSKFTSAKYGKLIAQKLSKEHRILSIEDFSDSQIFSGVTSYVLIITVAKAKPVKRFSFTSFRGFDIEKDRLSSDKSVSLPIEGTLDFPWSFATGGLRDALDRLTNSSLPLLTDVFLSVFQGVRTGANEVYVLDREDASELEPAGLLPFVSGREISRQSMDPNEKRLIFPYQMNSFRQVEPIPLNSLNESFPRISEHLRRHEAALRERSIDDASPWYCFSRAQNLSAFLKPKILVKEMMPRAEFACDLKGEVAFCSGYALDASQLDSGSVTAWTAVLNTPTMEFALRQVGTQLHSGWFRVLKHQLGRLRLPPITQSDWKRVLKLGASLQKKPNAEAADAVIAEIDEIVARSFNLTPQNQKAIADHLMSCHERSMVAAASKEARIAHDSSYEPVKLERFNALHREAFELHHLVTFKAAKTQPIHRWYPYTQGFDPALVTALIKEFKLREHQTVLDPFGGVGTTGLACRIAGLKSVVNDVSPLMTWICKTKNVGFTISGVQKALSQLNLADVSAHPPLEINPQLFRKFFDTAYAPTILRSVLSLLGFIESNVRDDKVAAFLKLMLLGKLESLSNIRKHGSHYRYLNNATSIGLEKLNIPIAPSDTNVVEVWLEAVRAGLADIATTKFLSAPAEMRILLGDARNLRVADSSVDAVITSPPYLNRNNYIAQQKGELALLKLVTDAANYKTLVRSTLTSHVEGTLPATPRSKIDEINKLIEKIVLTEGNNPKIPCMIAGYFDDTAAVLADLARVCKPGAKVAFVVGNTRWGGIVIPVDHLIMLLAEQAGFQPEKIMITRYKGNSPQQMRRFGRIAVRESIVIFSKSSR